MGSSDNPEEAQHTQLAADPPEAVANAAPVPAARPSTAGKTAASAISSSPARLLSLLYSPDVLFYALVVVWVLLAVLTHFIRNALLAWVEQPFVWAQLIHSFTSSSKAFEFWEINLYIAWLPLLLFIIALWNLILAWRRRTERAVPAVPQYLLPWLGGVLALVFGWLIGTTVFT
jgi:hypothetical protein